MQQVAVRAKTPAAKTPAGVARPAKAEPLASARSLWTGQLRLALVTIPVQLAAATSNTAHLAFHQVDKNSRKRIHYEKTAPGIGKVPAENIVKGFEVARGKYVLVTDAELDRLKMASKRVIDLVQFVDYCEVDPIFFDKPYYVVPDGGQAAEAYAVLRDALRATGKMGIGQFVMRGREYVAALKPCGRGLLLETLRFADEVRHAAPFFTEIGEDKPDAELLDLAKDLIQRKSRPFDAGAFHDHYTEALRALIDAKAKNQVAVSDEPEAAQPGRGNVVDLVEALRRSVSGDKAAPRKRRDG